jgi:hypothetical protein
MICAGAEQQTFVVYVGGAPARERFLLKGNQMSLTWGEVLEVTGADPRAHLSDRQIAELREEAELFTMNREGGVLLSGKITHEDTVIKEDRCPL